MHQGIPHNSPIQFNQLGIMPPQPNWFSQNPVNFQADLGRPFPTNQLPKRFNTGPLNAPPPGNAPFYNPGNPEGSMFPVNQLPNRSHFNRVMPGPTGPMIEGNNPPINMPPPSLPSIGPFAQYMRRIGMPLPNDPVANAPLGLGLGFR